MGLNFHVRCKTHKVVGMIPRGHESQILHWFYKEHSECRQRNPFAVEVEADEESERDWMSDDRLYQDINDQIYDQIEQLRERHKKRESQ